MDEEELNQLFANVQRLGRKVAELTAKDSRPEAKTWQQEFDEVMTSLMETGSTPEIKAQARGAMNAMHPELVVA